MMLGCEEVQNALRVGDEGPLVKEHLARCTSCRAVAQSTLVINPDLLVEERRTILGRPLAERLPWLIAAGMLPVIVVLAGMVYLRARRASDAASVEREIQATPRAPRATPTLTPLERRLVIESSPTADIWIDGRPVGQSPITVSVQPGRVLVEARAEGCRPAHKVVAVGDTELPRLAFALERRSPGGHGESGGGHGESGGGSRPDPVEAARGPRAEIRAAAKKPEAAELADESFAPMADRGGAPKPLAPAPSETKSAPAPAPIGFGWLTITTDRWAKVILDGKDIGRTTPLNRFTATAGHHRVELRAREGAVTVEVDVKPHEEVEIDKTIE